MTSAPPTTAHRPSTARGCTHCGAILASHNTGTRCGPCRQRVGLLLRPPPVDPAIWSAVEVRAAARRRHFGQLIRAYRLHARAAGAARSQEQVAEWLGITQPQLSRIETGPPVTDLERLIRWARALEVPADLLWFRIDDPEATAGPRDIATPTATGTLRIGIIAPPWIPVPPPAYGGTELVLDVLARGLAHRGHDVVLFATGDSTCPVRRAWFYDRAVTSAIGTTAVELNHAAAAYEALNGCDIIHDSTLAGLFIGRLRPEQPIVSTNHGPFAPVLADVYRRTATSVPLVAISDDQASRAPADIPVAAVIHHGIDLDRYPFRPTPGNYCACLGRMIHDKGIDRAIKVARQAGVPLKIAAKMREPAEQRYFAEVIEPLLGDGIEYVGEADHQAKIELLGGARALLNPIRWPEPFGLVAIEALACGTPVVTTPCGAAPELVDHQTTGFVGHTAADLVEATRVAGHLDRRTCRQHAVERFSMHHMADRHEALYRTIIQGWGQPQQHQHQPQDRALPRLRDGRRRRGPGRA